MTEQTFNENNIDQSFSSVHDVIRKFNMLGKFNDSSSSISMQIQPRSQSPSTTSSTISINLSNTNEILFASQISTIELHEDSKEFAQPYMNEKYIEANFDTTYLSPTVTYTDIQSPTKNNSVDDIGLEIIENLDNHNSSPCESSIIEDYVIEDIQWYPIDDNFHSKQEELPAPPPPLPPTLTLPSLQQEPTYHPKRTLPLSNFLLETGILVVTFIVCMILVLAIREDQESLRIITKLVFIYIYLVSTIWMLWCTFDIIKFRQEWIKFTSSAQDQEDYMDIVERYPYKIFYFPDTHNTGGLFMRIGAGLLCMGSLLLNLIQLAKTIEILRTGSQQNESILINHSQSVFVITLISFMFRFVFHCVQYIFLFRYGNIIIDRYHFMAKIGLIHIIIANFCTWFEAIVVETLDELRKHSLSVTLTSTPMIATTTKIITKIIPKSGERVPISCISFGMINCFKKSSIVATVSVSESSSDNMNNITINTIGFIEKIESAMNVYLYPCFIEYSLICVTVFYIMWRNVGKSENQPFLHFGERHIFTIDCSRASRGLLLGGIIFILAILTLIPVYILNTSITIQITHIAELILIFVSLVVVSISFFHTTKLYYDRQARVDIFDQILILVTTIGDFAYSFFCLFASIFIESYTIQCPRFVDISMRFLSIFQTFIQSGFILDTLKRRLVTKNQIRKKPGRELITALLLINLAIWMHDSLSAKKIKLNPIQNEYYHIQTWSIIQAFTSPLSIFYRFHSSVCLADIWQEVYSDHKYRNFINKNPSDRSTNSNNIHK